jgi:hypothetical protein
VGSLDVQREKNHCGVEPKIGRIRDVKRYWEIIANNPKKRGWSYGYVSAVDPNERTIWIADARSAGARSDGAANPKGKK